MSPERRINSYRDLLVWQKAMVLAKQVYRMTRGFPGDERFGLIAQMRRAAVSVPRTPASSSTMRTTPAASPPTAMWIPMSRCRKLIEYLISP